MTGAEVTLDGLRPCRVPTRQGLDGVTVKAPSPCLTPKKTATLTSSRDQVLQTIASIQRSTLSAPTLHEVANAADMAVSTVHHHVKALRASGLLKPPSGPMARTTRLTALGWRAAGMEPGKRRETPLGSALSRVRLPSMESAQGWSTRERVLLACALLRGECAPTLREVSQVVGVSVPTVHGAVQGLRVAGLLVGCDLGATRRLELTGAGADALVLRVLDSQLEASGKVT